MNRAFCNACGKLVEATQQQREGKVFLVKDCPDCGKSETLISSDAQRYYTKRSLDGERPAPTGCFLKCLDCAHKNEPTFVFLDITNRCNSNCPICINNTPSMGFLFEPPLDYFEKVFEHFARSYPRPVVQLFGGEPTVREDLFEIIALAKAAGLRPRVVTNGLRLADPEYCQRLVESRATILFAYDGANPETYRVLRGNEKHLSIKQKALDNLSHIEGAKVALMTCMAKGFNDTETHDLLKFCHERRHFIRGIYFMPLAQTWQLDQFDLVAERMTNEDLEILLNDCFPDERIDFAPAGVLGDLKAVMQCLDLKPPPFAGAHPNCESFYLLPSNGQEYVPLSRYLKGSLPDLIKALLEAEARIAPLVGARRPTGLKKHYLALRALLALAGPFRRNFHVSRLLKGRGVGKLAHLAAGLGALLVRQGAGEVSRRHTTWQGVLQIIVLPFEDNPTLETERLQRCPNAFAFYDPVADRVNYVPTCAWSQHKTPVMRRIADYYAQARAGGRERPATAQKQT
ncbi:MAG: radical SAM protein [Planctomycetes bacterium]|nr:radical SAM protein [Planctomycetota bacterium]